jgi:peroxiredoxin
MRALFITIFLTLGLTVNSQKLIPDVKLKTLKNKTVSTNDFNNKGEIYVISFFATWCKPCINELNSIAEEYEDWSEDSNFKLIAISIDDSKSKSKVKSIVKGNDWPFEFYLDENSNLKRALNIVSIPYVLIVNSKREILWEKSSYTQGAEFKIYEKFKSLKSR